MQRAGAGILAAARVITTAFSEDVLVQRHNSELLELGSEQVLVLRVVEHEESRPQSLDKVRGEIESILKQRGAAKLAEQKGHELMTAMAAGADAEQLASENGVKLHQAGVVGRASKEIPLEVLDTLFTMSKPDGEKPVYGKTTLSNGDHAVITLYQVTDGSIDALGETDRSKLKKSLERMLGQCLNSYSKEAKPRLTDFRRSKKSMTTSFIGSSYVSCTWPPRYCRFFWVPRFSMHRLITLPR